MGTNNPVLSEHQEQALFVQWFRRTFPDIRIFAIPNGGARNIVTAGKLKAEGVSPGVPDLFIPEWLTWVEMKRARGGSVSADQKDWHQYLVSLGHKVILGFGCDDAINKIIHRG